MIKILDIAYVRFAAPDLDAMERFLADFGLVTSARVGDLLYARATDPAPYVHVTERGEPAFLGTAFEAASADDLAAAAELPGASPVEKIEAPGGGSRVRFTDPDGFQVEVVHGRELLAPLPVPEPARVNRGSQRLRFGALHRVEAGPASVKRLGHVGLRVADFRRSEAWYKQRFGFLTSDEISMGGGDPVAAFIRCDRGKGWTDHHTLVCVGAGEASLDHASFEVEDIDALMAGHDELARQGHTHHAGIGRHVLGSQIFDYWRDPWGFVVEHYADGDLLNEDHTTGYSDPATALGTQWGSFSARPSPEHT